MEKAEYRRSAEDMIALTACALNGTVPDRALTERLNLPQLFEVCQAHNLTACAAYALESAGVKSSDFSQAKEKAIRKNILLDAERKKILHALEEAQIWYMPLKGAILKDWYPKLGMRQMTDNDILCDSTKRAKIRDIMYGMGFTCEEYGKGKDDAYKKPPVYNMEMHAELFMITQDKRLYDYYADVKSRLLPDENSSYGYHFTREDFYLYMIAHEYKHYTYSGTGVRFLADTYVFFKKCGDTLDRAYLETELQKLGLGEFERGNRVLAEKLFSGGTLTDAEQAQLDRYIFAGTFGSFETKMEKGMQRYGKQSRVRYLLHRIFPPLSWYKVSVPWAYKHKWLLPAGWVWRIIRGLRKRPSEIGKEIAYLQKKE